MFFCLCYVKGISTDMLEEQVLEERDPDLNEEYIKEDHLRDFAEYGDNKNNIHALR